MPDSFGVNPAAAGLAPARLTRIRAKMEQHIEAGRLAGGVGLIMRRGCVGYLETWGFSDPDAGRPMKKDAIFRIFSMTKPITGVAAMMLFEDSEFALSDPISKFIPEFGNMQVAIETTDMQTGRTVLAGISPCKRQITVLDLMRHTAGFNYTGPHDRDGNLIYPQRGIQAMGNLQSADFARSLAGVPLVFEPGTAWDHGYGTDVLGRLVEVISGRTLAEFLKERIFEPLGMRDTAFCLNEKHVGRLAGFYSLTSEGTIRPVGDNMPDFLAGTEISGIRRWFREEPVMYYGGAGLTSSLADYLTFARMLLRRGKDQGQRLLSPLTVDLMRSDLLGNLPVRSPVLAPGYGFGLTMAVSKGPTETGTLASAGLYRWGGAAGTLFWIDPAQDMIGIFLIQTYLDLVKRNEFMQLAYQAIDN